jgi:hypothetical protein
MIAQSCLTILPMYVVLWLSFILITVVVLIATISPEKNTRWDKLEN